MRIALLAVLSIIFSSAATAQAAAPQAVLEGPETAQTGEPVGFDAEASADPDGDQLLYAWSIDGQTLTLEHDWLSVSFAQPGRHVVRVTVTDGSGASGAAERVVVVTGRSRSDASVQPFGASVFQTDPTPYPELVVRPSAVRVQRHALRLRMRCRNAPVCKGRLRAVALVGSLERPLLLSKRTFTISRGGPRSVRMWLTPKARRRLAAHPRVRVTAYRGKVRVAHIWASYAYRVG